MKKRIDLLKEEVLDLQKRGIQYHTLKREVDTNRSLYDGLLQRFKEVLECASWEHDRVTPPANVFSDLHEATALVFLQVQEEDLPLESDLFRRNRIRGHPLPNVRVHHNCFYYCVRYAQTGGVSGYL